MKKKICVFILLIALGMTFYAFASNAGTDSAEQNNITEKMTLVVFQLGIILFAAWIGGTIFKKCKMPGVLGEILAGTIIGPYLLGGISLPGFAHGFFPIASNFPITPELYAFTTVASIVLLFLVGLETDLDTFLQFSVKGTVIGVGGVVISFILGNMATVFCAKSFLGISYSFADPIPLFLGIISTATSVGISARILSEKRKMDSPEGVTILSGAVIDDVLGIIGLAIVIGIIKSGQVQWITVEKVALKAIGIWLGFTVFGLFFAQQIGSFLKRFKDKNTIAVMSLALAMILAGIFEKSGLAMVIGAYIMGLSLSKTDLAFIIQDRLSIVSKLLVPMFFCVMGMLVNVKEIASPPILKFAIVFSSVAIASKLIGCSIPALFLNFNLRGALRVGVGMAPRGEVALIMAGIGLSLGILEHDAFTVAIVMTFITMLIIPPLLSKLLESKKTVLRKQLEPDKEHEQITYDMPNHETAEYFLYKIIEAFENEGFYVHVMEIPEKLYQIRKNNTFITFKYTLEKMTFDCAITDAAFIHTLFYEVIGELENMVKNFEVLTNKKEVVKKIFKSKDSDTKIKFNVKQLLHPLACECKLTSTDKEDVIEELVNLLIRSGQLEQNKKGEVLRSVFERENNMSTGMQDGIALPHTRALGVNNIMCAIGVKKQGIKFDSLDGQTAKIFVLTVAPKKNTQSYLQFMANVSKLLADAPRLKKIINSKSNDLLYNLFA